MSPPILYQYNENFILTKKFIVSQHTSKNANYKYNYNTILFVYFLNEKCGYIVHDSTQEVLVVSLVARNLVDQLLIKYCKIKFSRELFSANTRNTDCNIKETKKYQNEFKSDHETENSHCFGCEQICVSVGLYSRRPLLRLEF